MLGVPCSRALGAVLACAVSLQASGALPLIAGAGATSCGCHHHDVSPDCRCPVCTHNRELASGQRFLRSCGGTADPGLSVAPIAPAVPPASQVPPISLPAPSPLSAAPHRPPSPA